MDLKKIASRVARRLPIVAADDQPNYGGKGPFNLPADHVAAMEVPKGGACCEKCVFVDAENHACKQPDYVTWNGGDPSLPNLPLDQICSDWFQAGSAADGEESAGEVEPMISDDAQDANG